MIEKTRHVSNEHLKDFTLHRLDYSDYIQDLEHISSCDECAQKYSNYILSKSLLSSPHYLKSNIMEHVNKYTQENNKVTAKNVSIYPQLFFFSLKVSVAACGALLIIFTGALSKDYSFYSNKLPIVTMQSIDRVNNKLCEFSNKLINMEVVNYDK